VYHIAGALHDPLAYQLAEYAEGQGGADDQVRLSHGDDRRIGGEPLEEHRGEQCAEYAEDYPDGDCEEQPVHGDFRGLLVVPCPESARKQRVDADRCSHAHRDHEHLYGECQGDGGECGLTYPGDKYRVDNIIEGLHHHGKHDGKTHGDQQGADRLDCHLVLGDVLHAKQSITKYVYGTTLWQGALYRKRYRHPHGPQRPTWYLCQNPLSCRMQGQFP